MKVPRIRSRVRRAAQGLRENLVRALYGSPNAVRRAFDPPIERGPRGLLRVHVGCGTVVLPGWYNVDERWFPHVHHVGAANHLGSLSDASAEVVYASHVLEHLSHRDSRATLEEWSRVLVPGGVVMVAVPDFDKIVERYLSRDRRIDDILGPLMGEQDYDANTHRTVFNRKSLTSLLESVGFIDVCAFDGSEVLGETLWDNSKHEVSLNLAARKT